MNDSVSESANSSMNKQDRNIYPELALASLFAMVFFIVIAFSAYIFLTRTDNHHANLVSSSSGSTEHENTKK